MAKQFDPLTSVRYPSGYESARGTKDQEGAR